MRERRSAPGWKPTLMLIALAVTIAASPALAGGPRLVVELDEPYVVDGEVHPAGALSLRTVRSYTPSATLNEVWAGDRCLGLLIARRSDDPTLEASRNAVLFVRDEAGRLVLRGFAYRAADHAERYRYALLVPGGKRSGRGGPQRASESSAPLEHLVLTARLAP